MAFLDNSGDIILDAVLTDTGRKRLAQGDGSFKIVKFALGVDEIDYSSYNGLHPSGSAYFDLEILQTPIFEAFTNNTSTMNSKIISLTNNNLLYLPVMKLNNKDIFKVAPADPAAGPAGHFAHSGSHVLITDITTRNALNSLTNFQNPAQNTPGFINGFGSVNSNSNQIRVDQGLDTTEVPATITIDPELKETQYIIEIDSRFAAIRDPNTENSPVANVSFLDDDLIATYYLTLGTGGYIENSVTGEIGSDTDPAADDNNESITGPRGTNLRFGLRAATDVVASNFLFETLGTTVDAGTGESLATFAFIDTSIRVTGVTTGYRLDIPLRILKKQ